MKAKFYQKFFNNLTKEELEKEVLFISEEYSLSGYVKKIKKAPHNLLWDGEDDPSPLHTKAYFLKEGHDAEDVESYVVEIHKGDIVIEI